MILKLKTQLNERKYILRNLQNKITPLELLRIKIKRRLITNKMVKK